MPFTYEPLTPADRERMETLNIMVGWKSPNANEWCINHETGDFLVRIGPDREPPHWEWHAFWWKEKLHRVGLKEKDHPKSQPFKTLGYWLEIVDTGPQDNPSKEGVWPASRQTMSTEEQAIYFAALCEAVKVYAVAEAKISFGLYQKQIQPAPLPPGATPFELESTLNGLGASPYAIFQADFSRSI